MNRLRAETTGDILVKISNAIRKAAEDGKTEVLFETKLNRDIPFVFQWNDADEVNQRVIYALTELGYKVVFKQSKDLGVYECMFHIYWEEEK